MQQSLQQWSQQTATNADKNGEMKMKRMIENMMIVTVALVLSLGSFRALAEVMCDAKTVHSVLTK